MFVAMMRRTLVRGWTAFAREYSRVRATSTSAPVSLKGRSSSGSV